MTEPDHGVIVCVIGEDGDFAPVPDVAPIVNRALAEVRAAPLDIRLSRIDVDNLVQLTAVWNADRVARNAGLPMTFEGALSRLLQVTRDLVVGKDET